MEGRIVMAGTRGTESVTFCGRSKAEQAGESQHPDSLPLIHLQNGARSQHGQLLHSFLLEFSFPLHKASELLSASFYCCCTCLQLLCRVKETSGVCLLCCTCLLHAKDMLLRKPKGNSLGLYCSQCSSSVEAARGGEDGSKSK